MAGYSLAPEFLCDDKSEFGQVIESACIENDKLQQALCAVRACPEEAIRVVD